ncbi:MAG: sarcosine oxidase subunit gamma family protein [Pseudomonadota bacterium]
MSDPRSALDGHRYDGAVAIADAGPRGMISVKGDLGASGLKNAATGISGVDFPDIREANCVGEKGLLWMAPDEIMVLTPRAEAAKAVDVLTRAIGSTHGLVADVSDARALLYVEGAGGRDILGKLTPADLRPGVFGTGELRRTRLAQIPAAFWLRDAETFEVMVFRSVARYAFDLLANAARPGTMIGHH